MPDTDVWIQYGFILKAHGVRGELRLIPQSEFAFPESLEKVRVVLRSGEAKLYTVGFVREIHQAYLLALEEVGDRSKAEALKGAVVQIPREALPALGQGEYYFFEFIGASVFNESDEFLGTVDELLDNGGQILLRISKDDSEHFLPAVPQLVRLFDRLKNRLTVRVPEGLWED